MELSLIIFLCAVIGVLTGLAFYENEKAGYYYKQWAVWKRLAERQAKEMARLEKELRAAKRNDNRDPKTGRFVKRGG